MIIIIYLFFSRPWYLIPKGLEICANVMMLFLQKRCANRDIMYFNQGTGPKKRIDYVLVYQEDAVLDETRQAFEKKLSDPIEHSKSSDGSVGLGLELEIEPRSVSQLCIRSACNPKFNN